MHSSGNLGALACVQGDYLEDLPSFYKLQPSKRDGQSSGLDMDISIVAAHIEVGCTASVNGRSLSMPARAACRLSSILIPWSVRAGAGQHAAAELLLLRVCL
jgi:hypothetical protein